MAGTKTTTKKKAEKQIEIISVDQGEIDFYLLGQSPIYFNKIKDSAKKELMMPSPRKTAAAKASHLKHDPYPEFLESPYYHKRDDAPTVIAGLSVWFKKAMASAALDLEGATKAQIGRLVHVLGERVAIYGIPELAIDMVRQAGMNKAPDTRTRCVIPEWACHIRVSFTMPLLKAPTVTRLLAAAGMIQGVGDWRVEKGSADNGRFKLVDPKDADYKRIVKHGGREAQEAAMKNPTFFTPEAGELFNWFAKEATERGFNPTLPEGYQH